MYERLYCPDFGPVLGNDFRRPFDFPLVDALVWPLFEGEALDDDRVKSLLAQQERGHPLFYRRKISIAELLNELECGGVGRVLFQAIDPGQNHGWGIPNALTMELAEKYKEIASPIISVDYSSDTSVGAGLKPLGNVAGVSIFPVYVQEELASSKKSMEKLVAACTKEQVPLKIDLGNMYLPGRDQSYVAPEQIDTFAQAHPNLKIILSGADPGNNLLQYANLLKYRCNIALELDPRPIGGMSPATFLSRLFAEPGVVQNGWDRLMLGSATPTLEISQVIRGLWEATESLSLAQRSLLRIWMGRNAHRWYHLPKPVVQTVGQVSRASEPAITNLEIMAQRGEPPHSIRVLVTVKLQSFAVTQLLWLQPVLQDIQQILRDQYHDFVAGEVTVRSTHTTAPLLINEHEVGNFLELHYRLVEMTRASPDSALHTVAAAENRPDFNFPDHFTASTVGQRDVTIPYKNQNLALGGRENLYLLSTFGPRSLTISILCKLEKFPP